MIHLADTEVEENFERLKISTLVASAAPLTWPRLPCSSLYPQISGSVPRTDGQGYGTKKRLYLHRAASESLRDRATCHGEEARSRPASATQAAAAPPSASRPTRGGTRQRSRRPLLPVQAKTMAEPEAREASTSGPSGIPEVSFAKVGARVPSPGRAGRASFPAVPGHLPRGGGGDSPGLRPLTSRSQAIVGRPSRASALPHLLQVTLGNIPNFQACFLIRKTAEHSAYLTGLGAPNKVVGVHWM
nr:uncharacterized protein LOC104651124 [Saimiri boliviensis boliviensis]